MWALTVAGYNCSVEYMAVTDNSVADLLYRLPSNTNYQSDFEYEPDISDKTYQINAVNSDLFNDSVEKPKRD